MAEIRIGTQSWTSPALKATLYPPDARPGDYLKILSQTLTDTVEADGTFHTMPTQDTVSRWYAATPSDFVFAAKMNEIVTHKERLINAESETADFLSSLRRLREKLGVVVLQFPPDFHSGYFVPLERYLSNLPADVRFAIEIRHKSWMTPRFTDMLKEHRVALVLSDSWNVDYADQVTTDFCYIRLNGDNQWIPVDDAERIIRERERALDRWSELIKRLEKQGIGVYCYINDTFEGNAAASVRSLQRRLGLEHEQPLMRFD